MEQAEKLLTQNGISVDLISAAVGYSTPSSFFRAFAKYHNCTPPRICQPVVWSKVGLWIMDCVLRSANGYSI